MGSRGKVLFDLNELPTEEEEDESNSIVVSQPQKSIPFSSAPMTAIIPPHEGGQWMLNNHAFKHASSGSVFQPFVRNRDPHCLNECNNKDDRLNINGASTSVIISHIDNNKAAHKELLIKDARAGDREEGEWSDVDSNSGTVGSSASNKDEIDNNEVAQKPRMVEVSEQSFVKPENISTGDLAAENNNEAVDVTKDVAVYGSENIRNSDCVPKIAADDPDSAAKPRNVKGVEASYALRFVNKPAKKHKLDEHKEAMLGKKRSRQVMFINVEDAKNAHKVTTPKNKSSFPAPIITRTVKEASSRASPTVLEQTTEKQCQLTNKDQKNSEMPCPEEDTFIDPSDRNAESNGDVDSGTQTCSKRNNDEFLSEGHPHPILRQGSLKQSVDSRQLKSSSISSRKPVVSGQSSGDQKLGNKKHLSSKKQTSNPIQCQDASVERLIREVTSNKFWHHPEETELQRVPGSFESVEEYIRVFEPLLFEECRAQLHSTYEELLEAVAKEAHMMVRIKAVERRERGWYDLIVLPVNECKWTFKEGDVAVVSSFQPGSATQTTRSSRRTGGSNEDIDMEGASGRLVGTVRRYIPIDTRDPHGVIFHFYVGDSSDLSRLDENHILRKLQPKSIRYLSTLGSLTTTQREYIALHAFRRLNLQMQSAILKPSPEHFPKHEEQPPAMPDCFTQNFIDHLHRMFNGPQLAAIQWAALHTAAGTSNGASKRQDPWPFTLVQGPPGTGKTHTVWGMLNVIHLVQYQHYYAALLKKLAPESYKQASGSSSENVATGSIDEVLQCMDQNLFRTLPKLCPKPRMLVCAPSNAATDELLARVLDRGFIDGEMKLYRPDVARVGVDTQSRAAQAVSVERRTEQLLLKGRDEVVHWLHQMKAREQQLSQQISILQRELNLAAAAGRSQGSVGVDPDVLAARDHSRDVLLQHLAAAVENRDKVLVEMSRFLILESRFRPGSSFNMEDARAKLEASFANEAEIVFTTVSSSGRKIFSRLTHGFDMLVIDEAAQASEVAVLPPLTLGAARCVLVGDPQQLPATVISKAAGTLLYSRSLFERFQQAGCPTMLLSVQFRMHPQIRDFPSRYFYQGRLSDSDGIANLPDEAYYEDALLKPYVFYDVTHGRESHRGGSVSYQNIDEAQFALRLYERLQKFLKANGGNKVSIGIITPYKLQLRCLQREFEDVLNSEDGKDIYINTVDAFQGQERDVIIMSCVRASNHGVGFVADIRRMNVALTRARRALWVVGNANALVQSEDWAALITDAKSRNCYMDMGNIPKEFFGFKGSCSTPVKGSSSSIRGLRTSGQRQTYGGTS